MTEKLSHDLALVYAKAKLEDGIRNNSIYSPSVPRSISEMDFLADAYADAYSYYRNVASDESKEITD